MSETLSPEDLKRLFPNASRSTINANSPSLGAVETRRTEQSALQTLERCVKKRSPRKGIVQVRISLVSYRKRLLDPDAVAFSCKPVTDAIAEWIGKDDADPRIEWEWSQVKTNGSEGLSVKIEIL